MLLTNHTLTGVLLGLTIDDPLLLAPAGVASHLLLDVVPHFSPDARKDYNPSFRSTIFLVWGSLDFAVSVIVTIGACLAWPRRAGHIALGVVAADLPDLTYIPIVLFGRRRTDRVPGYKSVINFLVRIQWYERPPGIITEVLWVSLMLALIRHKL